MCSTTKFNFLDWLLIAGITLLAGIYVFLYFDFSIPPFEDAAMLMRYAKHIADGQGIVWNAGEKPVDGATDFLFMIFTAALVRTGMEIETAVRTIGMTSHFLTAAIVYVANRKVYGADRWIACLSASYLAFGVGLWYIVAYFGTPFFALSTCITWLFANMLLDENHLRSSEIMFALSSLVMGLIRPEGVILASFMLGGIVYLKGFRKSVMVIVYFMSVFLIFGMIYFLWRWYYFGYPLPNPFYKKGGGRFYISSLFISAKNAFILIFPFLPLLLFGFRRSKIPRRIIFLLIPVVGFICIWVLLSNEMNYLMRFQYAILPLVLISWPLVLVGETGRSKEYVNKRTNFLSTSIIVTIFALVMIFQREIYNHATYFRDGRYDIAIALSEYKQKNYTIATTEAGLLPFYSQWNALDTWGLNDQWIAHNGSVTEAYLDKYKPEIIMIHEFQYQLMQPGDNELWTSMVTILKGYAEKNGYVLAAKFGDSPANVHYYYVKPNFSDSQAIVRKIRTTDYFWYESGRKSTDFSVYGLFSKN